MTILLTILAYLAGAIALMVLGAIIGAKLYFSFAVKSVVDGALSDEAWGGK